MADMDITDVKKTVTFFIKVRFLSRFQNIKQGKIIVGQDLILMFTWY